VQDILPNLDGKGLKVPSLIYHIPQKKLKIDGMKSAILTEIMNIQHPLLILSQNSLKIWKEFKLDFLQKNQSDKLPPQLKPQFNKKLQQPLT